MLASHAHPPIPTNGILVLLSLKTVDGTKKRMDALRIGDQVLTFDATRGKTLHSHHEF